MSDGLEWVPHPFLRTLRKGWALRAYQRSSGAKFREMGRLNGRHISCARPTIRAAFRTSANISRSFSSASSSRCTASARHNSQIKNPLRCRTLRSRARLRRRASSLAGPTFTVRIGRHQIPRLRHLRHRQLQRVADFHRRSIRLRSRTRTGLTADRL